MAKPGLPDHIAARKRTTPGMIDRDALKRADADPLPGTAREAPEETG
jgi:hypothetical protein